MKIGDLLYLLLPVSLLTALLAVIAFLAGLVRWSFIPPDNWAALASFFYAGEIAGAFITLLVVMAITRGK